jgi:hypothetical protein
LAELSPDSFNLVGHALTDLYAQAQPRPDLGTKQVATFMGRVVRPGEGLASILSRLPQETPDAEGFGGLSLLAGIAPAAKQLGGKIFQDFAPRVAPYSEVLREIIKRGEPLRRSTLRPAIKTNSGVIVGDVAGGHGRLWESISPAQQKAAIDGYVDGSGRFMTRDQGTIASGSLEGIKLALQRALFDEK